MDREEFFQQIREQIKEYLPEDYQDGKVLEKNDPFYMLSNTDSLYGAAALVNKPLLSQVGKELGKDFYILPASMDGLIIVPKGVTDDLSWLKGISENQRINDRSSHDVLSDNILHLRQQKPRSKPA